MAIARDGKMFSSRQAMLAHERRLPPMRTAKDVLQMPGQGRGDDGVDDDGDEEARRTVAQHGPAIEVTIIHDHEARRHDVSSLHPDGYTTESDHPSAEEAHARAKALAQPVEDGDPDGDMDDAEFE